MARGKKSAAKSLASKKCNKPGQQRYHGICKPAVCYKGKSTERPRLKSGKCPKRARGLEDFEPTELYSLAGRKHRSPRRSMNYIRPGYGYEECLEDEFSSNY